MPSPPPQARGPPVGGRLANGPPVCRIPCRARGKPPVFRLFLKNVRLPLGGTEKARFSGLFLLVEIVLYSVLYRNVSLQDVVGLREQCERLLPFPGADAWGDAIRAGREASPKGRARGMDAPERTRKAATAAGRQGGPGQGCSAGPTVRHGCRSRGTPR